MIAEYLSTYLHNYCLLLFKNKTLIRIPPIHNYANKWMGIRQFSQKSYCTVGCRLLGSRDGVVVRALASHQCDPGFDSRAHRLQLVEFVVGWVCCWFSSLLWEVFLWVLWCSPLLKTNISSSQFDPECLHVCYRSLWLGRLGNHSSRCELKNWFDLIWFWFSQISIVWHYKMLSMLWFKFSYGEKFLKLVQLLFSYVMYSLLIETS